MIPANQLKEYSKKINSKKGKTHNKNYGECKKVILFTNARNEKNIKEWAAHHLLIGFSAICIFDHKSDVPIGPQFINFDKRVKVLRVEYENPVKLKLMNMAATIANQNGFDWMLYLDADEFLILNSFEGVKKMLTQFSSAHSLAVNWLLFGTNNHVKEPNGLILENYTRSQLNPDQHVKSFVRPQEVINATNPHFFNIYNPARMLTITNKQMPYTPNMGYTFNPCNAEYNKFHAYIAHYIHQSEETFIKRKVLLAADDGTGAKSANPEIHNVYNDVENNDPKNKYAERVKAFLQQFK
uniref:Glycosyltransferase family 92 protein n=1 Tax=viral metagenome TaxID=1070528 RepID=A0A6C0DTG3_9ZZZZ